ncbi:adenylate kinase [Clostridium sp. CAG:433]|nr:adenylate kinase [Clostridium sp. CAG:433]
MSNILLISAPGAGKGVTSEYLKEKYNMVHMSIGNLLREESEKNISLKEKLANGEFIENNIVYSLFSKFLEDNKGSSFIFEGFPRLMEQVKPFLDILSEHDIILDKIIFIDIDKDIALKRVTGRLMCKNCNEIYNKYIDNLENNKCKVCGGSLYTRDDDKVETYENRYKLFKEKTMPVVEYLSDKYDIYTVSNNGTFDEMKSQIDNIMGN